LGLSLSVVLPELLDAAAPDSVEDSAPKAGDFCLGAISGFLIGATGAGATNSDVVFFTGGNSGFWNLLPTAGTTELEAPRPGLVGGGRMAVMAFLITAPEDPGKGLAAGATFSLAGCFKVGVVGISGSF